MAYQYLTFAAAVSALAARLQDPSQIYWNQPNQLLNCVIESLRLFQCLTGSYKQKITFQTQRNVNYYDLPALCPAVAYTATDVEVTNNVLAALLEPPITYPVWTGTGQFTLTQLQNALQSRLNRFMGDTGCRVIQQTIQAPGPPIDLIPLPDQTLDVRRAAWISPSASLTWAQLQLMWQDANFTWISGALAYPIGRVDEWAEQAYTPGAVQNPGIPQTYSTYGTSPLSLRVVPPPLNEGLIDVLLLPAGPSVALNPGAPVLLQIPDDLSPALKWGVLADLLASDGPSRDYARAAYAEQRYQEFVEVAKVYPSMLTGDINNVTAGTGSVFDLDFYNPTWQQTTGAPDFIGLCGRNLACIGQTPDQNGPYGIGMWVVANAPVTLTNLTSTYMQIGRDQIDPILDYAQHIASFQMGGEEFNGTQRMFQNFVLSAKQQNARIGALSLYRRRMQDQSIRSEQDTPRLGITVDA